MTIIKTITLLLAIASTLAACGGATDPQQDSAVETPTVSQTGTKLAGQWAACGVDAACPSGLECFGVCTFECGQKYNIAADGSWSYGLDQASVDRCTALGGSCEGYASGVDINVCKQVSK